MLEFKLDASEEYYRKLLLLDKVTPTLNFIDKRYIFNEGYCWDILFKDQDIAELCYYYAYYNIGIFSEGEPYIATNAEFSYLYARDILRSPFPLGEKIIAKDGHYAYLYARFILNSRFPEGEDAILSHNSWAKSYMELIKN